MTTSPLSFRASRRLAALVFACSVLAGPAHGESSASGTFSSSNMHATFKDVYAYRIIDDFYSEGAEVTEVVMSEQPLDKAALAAAMKERGENSTTSVMWDKIEGAFAKLTISPDGDVAMYLYVPPGYNLNMSGTGEAAIKVNTAQRIEGSYKLNDSDSDGPRTLNLTFAADVGNTSAATGSPPPAPPPAAKAPEISPEISGDPLPAGGGEPGEVFQQALKAQRAGDVDTMLKLSDKEHREKMTAARNDPEFAQMIEMMKQMTPAEVNITGGQVNEEIASVKFTGKYSSGGTSDGTATLVREDGRWLLKKVDETIHGE